MTRIAVDEPDGVKLRRTVQDRALPKFASASELQAWLDEIDGATTVAQIKAVIKDKLTALAISVALAERQG